MTKNNCNNCKCSTPQYNITLNQQGPVGLTGDPGENGTSLTVEVVTDTDDEYILRITTGQGSFDTPNLKGRGLVTGGYYRQVLGKLSDEDFDIGWVDPEALVNIATPTIFGIVKYDDDTIILNNMEQLSVTDEFNPGYTAPLYKTQNIITLYNDLYNGNGIYYTFLLIDQNDDTLKCEYPQYTVDGEEIVSEGMCGFYTQTSTMYDVQPVGTTQTLLYSANDSIIKLGYIPLSAIENGGINLETCPLFHYSLEGAETGSSNKLTTSLSVPNQDTDYGRNRIGTMVMLGSLDDKIFTPKIGFGFVQTNTYNETLGINYYGQQLVAVEFESFNPQKYDNTQLGFSQEEITYLDYATSANSSNISGKYSNVEITINGNYDVTDDDGNTTTHNDNTITITTDYTNGYCDDTNLEYTFSPKHTLTTSLNCVMLSTPCTTEEILIGNNIFNYLYYEPSPAGSFPVPDLVVNDEVNILGDQEVLLEEEGAWNCYLDYSDGLTITRDRSTGETTLITNIDNASIKFNSSGAMYVDTSYLVSNQIDLSDYVTYTQSDTIVENYIGKIEDILKEI